MKQSSCSPASPKCSPPAKPRAPVSECGRRAVHCAENLLTRVRCQPDLDNHVAIPDAQRRVLFHLAVESPQCSPQQRRADVRAVLGADGSEVTDEQVLKWARKMLHTTERLRYQDEHFAGDQGISEVERRLRREHKNASRYFAEMLRIDAPGQLAMRPPGHRTRCGHAPRVASNTHRRGSRRSRAPDDPDLPNLGCYGHLTGCHESESLRAALAPRGGSAR
jgi:hypothetical protein